MMVPQYNFKIAVIGASGVGKTSLINQFILKKFAKDYISTIGVNILLKDLTITLENDSTVYECQLMFWDVGGQEKFNNVRQMFYKGTNGAIIVYDITRPATFTKAPVFLEDLQSTLKSKVPYIILGNKNDLQKMRRVECEEGNQLMKGTNALAFFETSAKTGDKVEDSFHLIAKACLKNVFK